MIVDEEVTDPEELREDRDRNASIIARAATASPLAVTLHEVFVVEADDYADVYAVYVRGDRSPLFMCTLAGVRDRAVAEFDIREWLKAHGCTREDLTLQIDTEHAPGLKP